MAEEAELMQDTEAADAAVAGGSGRVMGAFQMLQGEVQDMTVSVENLAAGLAQVKRRVDGPDFGADKLLNPAHFAWPRLDGRQARSTWIILIDWVSWLTARFRLHDQIPPCWPHPDHGAFVEELGALCLAWHGAYTPKAKPEQAVKWMEALARAQARWREWDDTRCRHADGHVAPMPAGQRWIDGPATQSATARADVARWVWQHYCTTLPAAAATPVPVPDKGGEGS